MAGLEFCCSHFVPHVSIHKCKDIVLSEKSMVYITCPRIEVQRQHVVFRHGIHHCDRLSPLADSVQFVSADSYPPQSLDFETLCNEGRIANAIDFLFFELDKQSTLPPVSRFVNLFKACGKKKSLTEAKLLLFHVLSYGLESFNVLCEGIIDMLIKCDLRKYALQVLFVLPDRTENTWKAVIIAYIEAGDSPKAFKMFQAMLMESAEVNKYTFVNLFKACANVGDVEMGMLFHEELRKKGLNVNMFIASTIIAMYGKCGRIIEAEKVFVEILERDIATWNAMLSAYVDQGQEEYALLFQENMQDKGVSPNERTFVIALQACCMLFDKTTRAPLSQEKPNETMICARGQTLHADACTRGFESDIFLANTLIIMYGKFGNASEAECVFVYMSSRNVVSWTSLLSVLLEHGEEYKVLHAYRQMQAEGVKPNEWTLSIVLQACCVLSDKQEDSVVNYKVPGLRIGRAIHADARKNGLHSNIFVGSHLVSMYGKCGKIVDAENACQAIHHPDAIAWSAMMSAYVEHHEGEKTLQLFNKMYEEYVILDDHVLVIALQALSILGKGNKTGRNFSLEIGEAIHADAVKRGSDVDTFVSDALLSMYSKCGSLFEAEAVFCRVFLHDAKSWMSILSAYVDQDPGKALKTFRQMLEEGLYCHDGWSFVMAIQACCALSERDEFNEMVHQPIMTISLEIGKALHADALKKGILPNVCVESALLGLYGTHGSITEAESMYSHLSVYDVVTWNAMLSLYVKQRLAKRSLQFFLHMQKESVNPNSRTFMIILQACSIHAEEEEAVLINGQLLKIMCLEIGKAIHEDIESAELIADHLVVNSLISMYGKCGDVAEAENLFDSSCQHNPQQWNTLISIYNEQGYEEKALQLFNEMWKKGIAQDGQTFIFALQACAELAQKESRVIGEGRPLKSICLELGRALHSLARSKCLDSDAFVSSSLINMYGNCGSILEAENVYTGLLQQDVVLWNSILFACVDQGKEERALQLYTEMQRQGFNVNSRSVVMALQACCAIADNEEAVMVDGQSLKSRSLEIGRALHFDVWQKQLGFDAYVAGTLVSMYAKCGSIAEAESVFSESLHCGPMVCNAMISAYVNRGQAENALKLFMYMQKGCLPMDHVTFFYALQACSMNGTRDMCMQIHFMLIASGCDSIPLLETAIIQAYGNCADVRDAQATFDVLQAPDVASWTALLTCYAQQGSHDVNLYNFMEMQFSGVRPDGISFLPLLCTCNHAGITTDGIDYFKSMLNDYAIDPKTEHFSIVIDMLGRAGDFESVKEILSNMPSLPDLTTCLCLLNACRQHGNIQLGKEAFKITIDLYPKQDASYILMANIYANDGV